MRINLGIRRRLAPLLENDRRKIELMNALLFSLPGTPVIYYGDEIGMGDNIYLGDRNGVRTPMQWSADRNAGFSRSNPQKLYLPITIDPQYHYESVNVEAQQTNPHSLLWWMKHLIEQRKQFKAFGRGTLEFLRPTNRKVLAFYRRFQEETILVVANLSRFPQHVELDLAASKGLTPVEVFGRAEFPPIGDGAYILTLGALSFYWLSLEPKLVRQESVGTDATAATLPLVSVDSFDEVFQGRTLAVLLRMLPEFLKTRRWFQGKDRTVRTIDIQDTVTVGDTSSQILLARIGFSEGDPQVYVLPGSVAGGEAAERIRTKLSDVSVMKLRGPDGSDGVLYSAVWNPAFADALLGAIARRRRFKGRSGELIGSHTRAFRKAWGERHPSLEANVLQAEQTNTSIVFGDRFILKLYRRIEPGIHPEIETGAFLTEHEFPHTAPLTGMLEYRDHNAQSMAVGVLHGFVQNQGDAWHYTLDSLGQFLAAALAAKEAERGRLQENPKPWEHYRDELPPQVHELIGAYADSARLLGHRTAELHNALSSDASDLMFAAEPFTDHSRQAFYHSMMGLATQTFQTLRQRFRSMSTPTAQDEAKKLLEQLEQIRRRFRAVPERKIPAMRIRLHDDLRLEEVLYTGKDFVFVGFGGKPDRPLGERRIKRSPLRDVASMLLSFDYAGHAALFDQVPGITRKPQAVPALEWWSGYWSDWVSAQFLNGYFATMGESKLLPQNDVDVRMLLEAFLLEKALEEMGRDLADRPDWARIPIRMMLRILS